MTFKLFTDTGLTISRNPHGLPVIEADSESLFYHGLGIAHATDRGTQMLLMRILGKGEGSKYLEASDEMFEIDSFFRKMGWHSQLEKQVELLSESVLANCKAYCEGANHVLKKAPLPFKLLGYKPTPWQIEDSLLLARMTGYLTLAQSQSELERFIVQLVQSDLDPELLHNLFPQVLEGIDFELLKKVKLGEQIIPEAVLNQKIVPPMMASNNWVVSPQKSDSGHALLSNDPHLEGNRMPNVWYEIQGQYEDKSLYGATMPGLPGVLIGRTENLSWGATYTFMDAADSWVEECKDGQYFYENEWHDFQQRQEVIERKKGTSVTLTFYENQHGVLDGNPFEAGHYLSSQWSGSQSGARSINAMRELVNAKNAEEGQHCLGQLETAWNWVLADDSGNIAYQMSGLCPKRAPGWSGLYPVPGWLKENNWQGFVDPLDLPRQFNPESGYIVTANQDLNALGNVSPINAPMGDYRARRISQLIEAKDTLSLDDFKSIQMDIGSLQAQEFLPLIASLLPDTTQGNLLKNWDGHYSPEKVEPYLFERVYQSLFQGVFGQVLGKDSLQYILNHTGLFADFYAFFDGVLFSEDSPWFQGQTRDELYRPIIEKALDIKPVPWQNRQTFELKHILLGGKLPRWAKVDYGPIALRGGRATPHQGQIYRAGDRITSFMPTYRMMTDMGTLDIESCLLGGPSDLPLSKYYASEVDAWQKGHYKKTSLKGHQ